MRNNSDYDHLKNRNLIKAMALQVVSMFISIINFSYGTCLHLHVPLILIILTQTNKKISIKVGFCQLLQLQVAIIIIDVINLSLNSNNVLGVSYSKQFGFTAI